MIIRLLSASIAAMTAFAMHTATADPVAEFYKGKTIRLVLPNAPGGSTTLYGLTVSEYWSRHIPGNPAIAVEYRVGASGMIASNYTYNAAPKDGTSLLMLIAGQLNQDTQPDNARYVTANFSYIGRAADLPRAIISWGESGFTNIEQALEREFTMATGARGSVTHLHPSLLNLIVGTKFKIVSGYRGAGPMYLALERGEADAASVGFDGLLSIRGSWIKENKVNVLAMVGSRVFPGFEQVPNIVDLAKDPKDRELLQYSAHQPDMGQVFVGPPGMPADRLEALRRAFDATMKDPEFLATAKEKGMVIVPRTGEEMQAFAEKTAQRSQEVVDRLRAVVSE